MLNNRFHLHPVWLVLTVVLIGRSSVALAQRPNVILVITDDQGYGDIAAHGNPQIKTPHLDELHARSIRLTNFHVDPTCSPTRSALMSGRYSTKTGVWHTIAGRSLMDPDELTLAEIFQANGYRTCMIGKWHLGDAFPCRPQDQGFDTVVHHGGGGVGQTPDWWGNDYFDDTYWRDDVVEQFDGYCTDVWFREAIDFIEHHRDQPFFLYLSTNAPHGPYFVDRKYSEPYGEGATANFLGMITNIDENLGKMFEFLRDRKLVENTLFIFMTDNGTAAGAKVFNAGMRGSKGSQYEGGHRVPFFLHWPAGELTGGRDVDQLSAHIDVRPTLVELCGLDEPDGPTSDGVSLAAALRGDKDVLRDRTLFVHSQRILEPEYGRRYAVMTDRWRLVDGKELYEIGVDPGQKNDLSAADPRTHDRLREAYDRWWSELGPARKKTIHVALGTDEQPTVRLTAHDWLFDGQTPWHQNHIRKSDNESKAPKSGAWAVRFARPGTYEIVVSRWPRHLRRSMDASRARLLIGDQAYEQMLNANDSAAIFRVPIRPGETRLQAFLYRADNAEIGAYFVNATRVED